MKMCARQVTTTTATMPIGWPGGRSAPERIVPQGEWVWSTAPTAGTSSAIVQWRSVSADDVRPAATSAAIAIYEYCRQHPAEGGVP